MLNRSYGFAFGSCNLGAVPTLLLWTLAFGVIGHVLLRRTIFGCKVLASGGGETTARYSGVDTASIKLRERLACRRPHHRRAGAGSAARPLGPAVSLIGRAPSR